MTLIETTKPMNELPKQPIRLGIQGAPGTGKTWSALTFPNPIIWNLDNKLQGYLEANPTSIIPVVNPTRELIAGQLRISNRLAEKKPDDPNYPINIRDGFKRWLDVIGPELKPEQTLIIDSWSSLMNWFEIQTTLPWEIAYTRTGEEDGFKYWGRLKKYCVDITEKLKVLPCNTVVLLHEQPERDENDRITGKLKPLMQGSFKDQFAGQLTNFYRQKVISKEDKDYAKSVAALGFTPKEDPFYVWQTKSDSVFNACCSIPGLSGLVPACYSSLVRKS